MMGGECGGVAHHLSFCCCFCFPYARSVCVEPRAAARHITMRHWLEGWDRSERCAIPAGHWQWRAATPASHALLFTTSCGYVRLFSLSQFCSVLFCLVAFARCCFVGRSVALLPVVDCSRRPV